MKTWFPSRVASQRLPAASKSSERGPLSGVPAMGEPSGVGPALPVPAKVLMTPLFMATLRRTWLPMSQMKRSPAGSNWRLCGCLNVASFAGPPSPE